MHSLAVSSSRCYTRGMRGLCWPNHQTRVKTPLAPLRYRWVFLQCNDDMSLCCQ